MYCGDETGAFVGDVSSYSSCFGYGGEDCPKSVLPSYMCKDGTIPTTLHRLPPSLRQRQSNTNTSTSIGTSIGTSISTSTGTGTARTDAPNVTPSLTSFQKEDDIVPIFSPYPTGKDALNPDSYLENDGLIQNYDAYENVWIRAIHDLNVRHLGKHYRGYGSNDNATTTNEIGGGGVAKGRTNSGGRVKIRRIHQVSSSNIKDAKKIHYDDSLDVDNQMLIHPLLAIDSGHTAFHNNNNNNGNSDNIENTAASTAIRNKQRSKIMEILFESLSAPAAFIAPSPMLSSFAFGRQTSLIVDIGARGMRVTPIVDGLLLENAQRRSGRGGEWLNSIQNHVVNEYLDKKRNKNGATYNLNNNGDSNTTYVHPRYTCQNGKDGINVNYPYTNIQQSIYHDLAVRDVMYEMKTSPHISGVDLYRDNNWTIPFLNMNTAAAAATAASNLETEINKDDKGIEAMDIEKNEETNKSGSNDESDEDDDDPNEDYEAKSKKSYTLPDGTKINLQKTQTGKDLCRVAELFFAQELPFLSTSSTTATGTDAAMSSSSTSTSLREKSQPTFSSLPIHELIKSSLTAVADADVRKELCGNIILTGASSLFPKMEQRLSLEVSYLVPNMYRCKVICSRNTVERRYSPWIGGSVLTSLGSFQQLWLSKAEYDEYGAMLGTQKFP